VKKRVLTKQQKKKKENLYIFQEKLHKAHRKYSNNNAKERLYDFYIKDNIILIKKINCGRKTQQMISLIK
jgi:hypothetical protein